MRLAALSAQTWLPILIFLTGAATAFVAAGFRMPAGLLLAAMIRLGAIGAAAALLLRRPQAQGIGFFFNALLQVLALSMAGMMSAYAAATVGRPLADDLLARADHALGYDWHVYATLFAGRIGTAFLTICYDSIFVQPILLLVLLTAARRYERVQLLLLVNLVALVVTTIVFAAFPATTAWTALDIPASELTPLHLPVRSSGWIHDLIEIRSGAGRLLTPDSGSGLIAFPSFHCAAALIYCWAAWPLRRWRIAFVPLNVGMIAATPIIGGHYLIDLIGGGLVTACAIPAATLLQRTPGTALSPIASPLAPAPASTEAVA